MSKTPKGSSAATNIEELKRLWREGIESGPGRFRSMEEIKAEARRRFERGDNKVES